ncbi:MAG: tetratricopeptide repeat-containing sensor histidine kinase [Bacteroidales bacterium]
MRCRFMLLSIFLIIATLSKPQNRLVDSLHKAILESRNEKEEILNISDLAGQSAINDFEAYNSQLLEIIRNFENLDDNRQFAKYYFFQGEICFSNNENLLSLVNFFRALDFLDNSDTSYLSYVINHKIGICYFKLGSYQKACNYIEKAVLKNQLFLDTTDLINSYKILGQSLLMYGKYHESLKYYLKASDLAKKIKDDASEIMIEIETGILYLSMNKKTESEHCSSKALFLSEKKGFKEGICLSYLELSDYHKSQNSTDSAIQCATFALNNSIKSNLDKYIYESLIRLIDLYKSKQDFQKALEYANLNIKYFETDSLLDRKANAYKEISDVYNGMKDFEKAIKFQNKFIAVEEIIHQNRRYRQTVLSEALQNYEANMFHHKMLEKAYNTRKDELLFSRILLFSAITVLILLVFFIVNLVKSKNRIKAGSQKIADQNKLILAQSEEISIQNDDLNKYKNNLEQLIEERTARLNETLRKAQESDRLKSSFLTNISHEIRTPMNAIIGFAQLLQYSEPDSNSQNLEIIVKNSYELLKTVENIVELAKIQSETYTLELQELYPLQIRAKIEKEASRIIKSFQNKKIEFKLNIPEFTSVFICDIRKLMGILNHLLENAFKYTENGSVSLECIEHENEFEFKVIDTGIGIAEKEIPHIFDVFYKVENQSRLARGTGIGLAIVKKLIDILKGHIEIQSEVGKGTIFSLIIPKIPE